MKRSYWVYALLLLASTFLFGAHVFAQSKIGAVIPDGGCYENGDYSLYHIILLVHNTIQFLFGIAGAIAFGMFVWGGYTFLLSAGKTSDISKGKEMLINAVIGLGIVFGSWVFINFVLLTLTGQQGEVARLFDGKQWNDYAKQECAKIKSMKEVGYGKREPTTPIYTTTLQGAAAQCQNDAACTGADMYCDKTNVYNHECRARGDVDVACSSQQPCKAGLACISSKCTASGVSARVAVSTSGICCWNENRPTQLSPYSSPMDHWEAKNDSMTLATCQTTIHSEQGVNSGLQTHSIQRVDKYFCASRANRTMSAASCGAATAQGAAGVKWVVNAQTTQDCTSIGP